MNDRATRTPSNESSSQNYHRPYILVMYLSLILFVVALAVGANYRWALVVLGSLVLYLIIYARLVLPVARQVANRKTSSLDERRIRTRDRAHYNAYQVLGSVLMVVVAYAWLAATVGDSRLPAPETGRHLVALTVFFANLVATLPASAVVWTEPYPPQNEET